MNYEAMVKEAYEEIIGLDKEAGVKDVAKKIGDAFTAKDYRDAANVYRNHKDTMQTIYGGSKKELRKALNKKMGQELKKDVLVGAGKTGLAYALPVAAIGGTALALKKHHDKKKEQAEKAAAYYDEAQLVKEAAEADYAEACAYEEAALAILGELGYLD